DDFDDVPTRAAEDAFELLDDLAVSAHGTVETLQVAVDDPLEIVETFARRDRDLPERFGLVHLAVAEERPDVAIARIDELAVVHVLHEARLIDRHDRAESHR